MLVPDPSHLAAAHHLVSGPMAGTRLLGADQVTLDPDAGDLPGAPQLQQIADGIGGWALVLSMVGLVVGAAAWALGSHTQNFQQTYVGRRAVLISGLAALLIGAAQPIINFFFSTGQAIKSS